jgi:hypothetical protein
VGSVAAPAARRRHPLLLRVGEVGHVLGVGENIVTKVGEDPSKAFNTRIYAKMSIGAVRTSRKRRSFRSTAPNRSATAVTRNRPWLLSTHLSGQPRCSRPQTLNKGNQQDGELRIFRSVYNDGLTRRSRSRTSSRGAFCRKGAVVVGGYLTYTAGTARARSISATCSAARYLAATAINAAGNTQISAAGEHRSAPALATKLPRRHLAPPPTTRRSAPSSRCGLPGHAAHRAGALLRRQQLTPDPRPKLELIRRGPRGPGFLFEGSTWRPRFRSAATRS